MSLTINALINDAVKRLAAAGVYNPQLDARLLVCHALKIDRVQLLTMNERILSGDERAACETLVARREKREPVGRILGQREFWGLSFALNEATLEPRPDSECLVETVLARLPDAPERLLDLGTGTGCLLLALLYERPLATGIGVDLSPRAVEQATANASALKLSDRARFSVSNWLDNVEGKFDVILSNPPYIPAGDIPDLMPEVREHDPFRALDGGADGRDPYRALIPLLPAYLHANGLAAFEVGAGQAPDIAALFAAHDYRTIETHTDLGGVARVVTARSPAP
jgi:release factor glutamine methyltransferase